MGMNTQTLAPIVSVDLSTFTLIAKTYRDELIRYATRAIQCPQTAEDIVQEVLLRLWINAHKIESPAHIRYWLFRATKNRIIDHVQQRRLELVPIKDDICGMTARPHLQVEDRMEAEDVLRHCTEGYGECLRLLEQGFDYQETADILGVPLGTVKSRMYQGRKRARQVAVELGWREAIG